MTKRYYEAYVNYPEATLKSTLNLKQDVEILFAVGNRANKPDAFVLYREKGQLFYGELPTWYARDPWSDKPVVGANPYQPTDVPAMRAYLAGVVKNGKRRSVHFNDLPILYWWRDEFSEVLDELEGTRPREGQPVSAGTDSVVAQA